MSAAEAGAISASAIKLPEVFPRQNLGDDRSPPAALHSRHNSGQREQQADRCKHVANDGDQQCSYGQQVVALRTRCRTK